MDEIMDPLLAEHLLSKYGFKTPKQIIAKTEEEAVRLASEIGGPVALKISSGEFVHKTELGGVKLNLTDEQAVRNAYRELIKSFTKETVSQNFSVLVQEMIRGSGIELIFGAKRDDIFGPVLLFGIGGVLAEVFKDTAVCVDPWTDADLQRMIDSIKARPLLDGYRGSSPMDRMALFHFAKQLGQLVKENPDLKMVDFNPVVQNHKGDLLILDAKLHMSKDYVAIAAEKSAISNPQDIKLLLRPRSIAVVGASNDPNKIGGMVIPRLLKFGFDKNSVFPINPKQDIVSGLACYKEIGLVPTAVDLACIAVPASAVPSVVKELGKNGVKMAIIFSSGFSEAGKTSLQQELQLVALENGVRLCGPNSEGVLSSKHNTFVSFSQRFDYLESLGSGSASIVSQSGGIMTFLGLSLAEQSSGFSNLVSTGNEADLELADFLHFFALDAETRAVGAFVEGIRSGKKFVEAAHALRRAGKPLVVYKSGKASKGAQVAGLHTGALAGSYQVFSSLLHQLGVIEAESLEEIGDVLAAFTMQPLPSGDRLIVASASGGINTIVADWCEARSIKLQELGEDTKSKLSEILPEFGAGSNPLDFTAQAMSTPSIMNDALKLVADEGDIFVVVMIGGMFFAKTYLEISLPITSKNKTLITCWLSPRGVNEETRRLLLDRKLPVYSDPLRALKVVEALLAYSRFSPSTK
ncbi:MAG: acetate--CoA ligase family protein [Thaumarchaeota archaeon]|nr:acetate--CoA ligase family protein [Nitrososphaerota archaeon]